MGIKLKDRASVPGVIAQMTLREKAMLVTGATPFSTQPIERLGIPAARMIDGGTGVNFVQYFNDLLTKLRLQQDSNAATGLFGVVSASTIKRILQKKDRGQALTEQEQQIYDTCLAELKKIKPVLQSPASFPPGMMLGATWDPETVRLCGSAVGREMDAYQVDLVLGSPNINVQRDPLNGRAYEGYSEDPCLNAVLAPQFVKGVQQEGPLANVKHFVANNQETCRHTVNVHVAKRALQEIYFPGFRACVQEGNVKSVMSAYNRINGTSCAMNRWLLTDILRDRWGFDGMVLSDWGAAYDQVQALQAGNDLDMPGPRSVQPIMDAVKDGSLSEEDLNKNVERILYTLLEMPVMKGRTHENIDQAYSRQVAHRCAAEGMVLLKNTGILPLGKNQKVSYLGEACKRFIEVGSGSTEVYTDQWTGLWNSAREIAGDSQVNYGTVAEDAQAVVIAVTAKGQEGSDRSEMELCPEDKQLLMKTVRCAKQMGKGVIVVLNVAGPVDVSDYAQDVDAILCVFFPGMEGGRVAAEVLYGDVNPSGKLPLTFPKHYRDCPTYGNFPGCAGEVFYGEGIMVGYRYYEMKGVQPAFAFGYGLSYTKFEISDLRLNRTQMDADAGQVITATVTVRNVGSRDGKEVVQLYIRDEKSTLDKPVKELKAFSKVYLQAGEAKEVSFTISKKMLESYDPKFDSWICEAGRYCALVGNSSDHICCAAPFLVRCSSLYNYGPETCLYAIYQDARSRRLLEQLLVSLGLNVSVLDDELYYRKFRPIHTILSNLTNLDDREKAAMVRSFYNEIHILDLSEI